MLFSFEIHAVLSLDSQKESSSNEQVSYSPTVTPSGWSVFDIDTNHEKWLGLWAVLRAEQYCLPSEPIWPSGISLDLKPIYFMTCGFDSILVVVPFLSNIACHNGSSYCCVCVLYWKWDCCLCIVCVCILLWPCYCCVCGLYWKWDCRLCIVCVCILLWPYYCSGCVL